MLGIVFKALLGLAGCASVGIGMWLWLDQTVWATTSYPRDIISYGLIGSGAVLIVASAWARMRSLIGLIIAASGTTLMSWAVLYAELNVWQLIPVWIAAFLGSFITIIYLIAACRGKDAF